MIVTSEIKARVEKRITACMQLASGHFGREFKRPTVDYKKRGTTAGTADTVKCHISLNSTILMENVDDFIARTVGHEVAHIIDKQQNGFQRRIVRGRYVRDSHGPNWKHIMRVFGQEPSRCHTYDVTNAKVIRANNRVKHVWTCGCGQGQVVLGNKRHQRQLRAADTHSGFYQRGHTSKSCGFYKYTHIEKDGVRKKLLDDAALSRALLAADAPAPKDPTFVRAPKVKETGGTKLEKCTVLYRENYGVARSVMIDLFVEEAGCTKAGAGTYYAKIKKELGG